MELISEEFIASNSLKKILDLNEYEQLKPLKCIQGLVNENYNYTDAYVFDNDYFYTIICHCIDIDLYKQHILKKLCIEYVCCHQKPSLRESKPYLIIVTKPSLFNEPISEDMDLRELFEIYGLNWEKSEHNPDINDITIKKTADMLLRKYNKYSDINSSIGIMVATFCDLLHEHTTVFYEDLLLIAQRNKNNSDIQHLNA
jgi:hypothetical protein